MPGSLLVAAIALAATSGECAGKIQAVRRLESAWLKTYETRDTDAMGRLLTDDFTITHTDASVQSKQDVLDGIRRKKGQPGPKFVTESVRGTCHGNTVILVGWVVEEDGDRSRYTDTCVRGREGWRVAASHLSRPRK